VKVKAGEVVDSDLVEHTPSGFRWETDAEPRARITGKAAP
jgi:hypothetical protein